MAATMTDSSLAPHRLPDSQLDSWTRNMSTEGTIYEPSTNDAASVYTTKSATSTRTIKDRFKRVFRRKKNNLEHATTEPPQRPQLKERKSSSTLRKKPPPDHIAQVKKDNPKVVWKDGQKRFSLDKGTGGPLGKRFSIDKDTGEPKGPNRSSLDKDTGETKDYTQMMHALVHHNSFDSTPEHVETYDPNRPPGEHMVASLPPKIWKHVADYLTLSDVANLAFSTKTLLDRLGTGYWKDLSIPYNKSEKLKFLIAMDSALPNHLYCPMCEIYHVRTQKGKESLKPTLTLNHLFKCKHIDSTPPRTRIASGRTLPFTFVQLALRAHRWGPDHGLTMNDLARRWKEPETGWSHTTVYRVHNGHLLMRVISQKFAVGGMVEAAKRGFFYNMYEDFTPYFSVCAHWRDGDLMPIVKCAVDHLPPPRYKITEAHKMQQTPLPEKPRVVAMCGTCQPMRRCPECPTEYLVELKLVEDLKDPVYRFKQAIVVTRWSDLGDGSTPDNIEWAAVNGNAYYCSIIEIGRRAISGIFESKTSNDNMNIPGQRIVSLNPKGIKEGEEGDKWF